MDAELLQLQRQFEAAQHAKASVRLSERNVVELVTKLQDQRLLPPLLYTVSGKEYLTQDQLRYEMEMEIRRLRRLSLIDLANTIGVDLFYCEKQAESIISSCADLTLVQGEVISTGYWDAIAEEINENLQETSQVSLADLAARLNVSSDTLTAVLEPRMGKLIQGKLEGGQLYTQAYMARLRAMIRGAVRALMVPTNLSTVWACLQQQLSEVEGNSGSGLIGEGKLFQTLFNGLLKEGAFCGSLRSGGSIWTPAVFEKAQHEGVEAFYSQNSYISYDMLRKLAISQPKQFLQGKYMDGVALETLFVHPSFISLVDAAIEEAVDGGGWVDCVSLVPPSFSQTDVARLVSFVPYIQKFEKEAKLKTLAETCVVSMDFIKVLLEKLEPVVKGLALASTRKESSNEARNGVTNAAASYDAGDVNLKGHSLQGKAGKRKGGTSVSEAGDDDHTSGKGLKGKKKGGRSRAGNSAAASNKGSKGISEKASSREEDVLSEDFIAMRLLESFPELEEAGIGDDGVGTLSKSIAAHLRPSLMTTWETAKQASFSAASEERRRRADTLQRKTDELYASLQLFRKALDLFDDDNVTSTALHRHLLRSTASQLVDVILQAEELETRLENGDACDESSIYSTEPLNSSERLSLAKGLTGDIQIKCIKMVESLEGKVFEEFELVLQEVADECGLRLKKLDRKAERALLSTYRKELTSQIEVESDPVALLPKVVALLFTQVHNKALQAPGRTMASVINHLKKVIPDNAYTTLVEYQSATVALLSMLSTASPGGMDCTFDRIEDERQRLTRMIPRLKEIVLSRQPTDLQ